MKESYKIWFIFYQTLPKTHRYTLGLKIDGLFIELIEMTAAAGFTSKQEKLPYLRTAIRKLDTIKVLLLVLWETKSLNNKQYIVLSKQLEEVGKMLGGWYGQVQKTPPGKNRRRNEESCGTTNANPLLRFHLLSGLSLFAFSHDPSSLRFALSRFRSPSDYAKHHP